MGLQRIYRGLELLDALIMDNAIHQAITDLSALIKDTDSEDAERIREIVERLQNFDAQISVLHGCTRLSQAESCKISELICK